VFRFILASLVSSITLLAGAPEPHPLHHPLVFEPNCGQAPAPVKWIARGSGYQLFLTQESLTMLVPAEVPGGHPRPFPGIRPHPAKYNAVRMKFIGSRSWIRITGLKPTGGVSNYYSGRPGVSQENIPHSSRVRVAGIYKGVDLVFYGNGGNLEYDLMVAPGANLSAIRLGFEGIQRMRVDDDSGDLVLTTADGTELRQFRPKIYQQIADHRVEIPGRYEFLGGNRVGFTLAAWDSERPLVIDPTVSFTRFLAGEASETAHAVAVDIFGNSYVTGETNSSHFPLRFPLVPQFIDCDAGSSGFCAAPNTFITKLSPEGNILFSTYFGVGSGYGIAVDSTGVYITGGVSPTGDLKYSGKWEVFIGKLSVGGGQQIYYKIVGGSDNDFGTAIAVDSQQSAWVTGVTTSRDFPGQTNPPSLDEVILIKVDSGGTVIFSRAFGGNDEDEGYGIAVDRKGDPWITGRTCSTDFFTTFDFSTGGCTSFVAAFLGSGTPRSPGFGTLRFITRFGGSYDGDSGSGIVVDAGDNAFVTGRTNSPGFITTKEAFQRSPASDQPQAFVVEFDPQGIISHSTLLGGDGATAGTSIALVEGTVTQAAEVFVSGQTASKNFPGAPPLTPNPTAGFVSKFSTDLSTLTFTTLLGAQVNGVAAARSVFDVRVAIFAAGWRFTGSDTDAFVVKVLDDKPATF
jgi:hypothetical protein